jgi:hypothetical protein
MDADALGPSVDIELPEPLEKGLLTAGVAVVLSSVSVAIADGSGAIVVALVSVVTMTAVFTTIYALA